MDKRNESLLGSRMKIKQELIQIHPFDTVAVAVRPLEAGEKLHIGNTDLTILSAIPGGHKVALSMIGEGEKIIKYGYPIGRAKERIDAGAHVHTHNIETMLSEAAEYHYDESLAKEYLKEAAASAAKTLVPEIQAFRRRDGKIGIRNEIWIVPTVGCVNRTAEALARWANESFAGSSGVADSTVVGTATTETAIEGVYAWTHPYGCSQMGEDHAATRTILADLVQHPNAGAVLVIGLGCENNTVEEFRKVIGDYDSDRVKFLVTQKVGDEIEEGKKILTELASYAGRFKRESVSASELVIGMKCGGSDGYSGITANALVGRVCDTLTAMGGTAILTEVPEMFGAEQMLMDRCESRPLFERTVSLIENFKNYYTSHNQVVYENPSPGNKDGGITTLEDKSCGCVQKGGKAPIRGVLRYGERISGKGLQLLEGPGNDIVSTTAMTASGAHLILFTTGRGTPLGAPVPTLKIASNTDLATRKSGWVDFDAGRLFTENADDVLSDLLDLIFLTASGENKAKNEVNGYREIAIFKDGVTL